MPVLKDYSSRCRQYTVNVLFVIQIYGLHTMKFCQQKDTILNASISQCSKESQGHIKKLSKITTYQALPEIQENYCP